MNIWQGQTLPLSRNVVTSLCIVLLFCTWKYTHCWMFHEQQKTITMWNNVQEWTQVLDVNTCSHLHSFCAAGMSSDPATEVILTSVSGGGLESLLHGRGLASDFIFVQQKVTVLGLCFECNTVQGCGTCFAVCYTLRSAVENPWLECGVVGDVIPCKNTHTHTHTHTQKLIRQLMLLSILKILSLHLTIVLFGKWLCQFWHVCKFGVRIIFAPSFRRFLLCDSNWKQTLISSSCTFPRWTMNDSLLLLTLPGECSYLFSCFPSLERRLAGEKAVWVAHVTRFVSHTTRVEIPGKRMQAVFSSHIVKRQVLRITVDVPYLSLVEI
jgi:hypothetical protein